MTSNLIVITNGEYYIEDITNVMNKFDKDVTEILCQK